MNTKTGLQLLPMPRQMKFLEGTLELPDRALIALDSPDPQALRFTAQILQDFMSDQVGVDWEIIAGNTVPQDQAGIVLSLVPGGTRHPQGYELTITEERVFGVASTPQGIFYAVQTLKQLLTLRGRTLPVLRIWDWPDFPNRGVMLDISRDKVYTLETLYELVDRLASWKVNQLQLYTEHTFAYRNHPVVWAAASPMTGEEILALDVYCRERFIELVPNQNSFGHMRRWLTHDEYRHLSECPEGCDTVWGHFDEPFTLNPGDPESLALIRGLYDELLPHFSSRQFNVGCDETVDLGRGRSKEVVEKLGAGRVYLDFLQKIYRDVKSRGLTMQYWGDVIMNHPDLVSELPRDAIALEWGYETNHPFDTHGKLFADSGVPFYVCPGTSSWNTVGGRTQNAIGNLINAAENGLKYGAIGFLNTDWGDNGHWQPLPVSYLGFAYGTAVSWGVESNRNVDLPTLLDTYVFEDIAGIMGQLVSNLGRVHELVDLSSPNATILFRILQSSPDDIGNYIVDSDRRIDELRTVLDRIDEVLAPLDGTMMQRQDADLLKREFTWVAEMLRHACWRGIWASEKVKGEEDQALKGRLASDAQALMAEFEVIWHARNRPGGFKDSLARMEVMWVSYLK